MTHTGGPLRRKTHGHKVNGRPTSEYAAWCAMKRRCLVPGHLAYHNYGGRGISVCSEWIASFEAFLAHVGPKPQVGFELDRINNDGNYEPGNVRWVSRSDNHKNRRPRARNGAGQYV